MRRRHSVNFSSAAIVSFFGLVGCSSGPKPSAATSCGTDPVAAAVAFVEAAQHGDRAAIDRCTEANAEITAEMFDQIRYNSTLEIDQAALSSLPSENPVIVRVPDVDTPNIDDSGAVTGPPHQSGVIVSLTEHESGCVIVDVSLFTSS